MKRRLYISIILTFILFAGVILWFFFYVQNALLLNQLQFYELLIVTIVAFSSLVSLCIEVEFILPFNTFLTDILTTWRKTHSLTGIHNDNLDELHMFVTVCTEILAESEARIKALDNKAELSEGYHQIVMMVSHQLRTPVTGLKWAFKEIFSNDRSIDKDTLIQHSIETIDRISRIIEDLLRGIQLEKSTNNSGRVTVDVTQLVQDMVEESRLLALSKHVSVNFTKDSTVPRIEGNLQQLRFALHALISNAINYSRPEGTVRIIVTHDAKNVSVAVSDTGIGIAKKEEAVLYTQFGRSKEAISFYPNGTGLSLYLAKNIVINHKGTITFVSEENKGTTFTVTLPIHGVGELETFITY